MMAKVRCVSIILVILFVVTPAAYTRDYIEVWPEGWSEITPFFPTSIFADRFFVTSDPHGTSFLSVDGLYFRELDLTYRLLQDDEVIEEVVLTSGAEIGGAFLGLDENGVRYALWIERSPGSNTIKYAAFRSPYAGHEPVVLLQTDRLIQDLEAYQSGGETHVVWSERIDNFQIRYAVVRGGEVVLLETVTDTKDVSVKPSVTLDQAGSVHMAWMETTPLGVEVRHSVRRGDGWSVPRKVGEGSVQDIEQGGGVSLASFGETVSVAWSALPRNGNRLAVYMTTVNFQGEAKAPTTVAMGSRPKFVAGSNGPELVWQGLGPFGAQVNYLDLEGNITNLTVGRKGAFRPEAYHREGFSYVYWLQAEADGGYRVYGIQNESPKALSLWRKVGIDESSPGYHILFLFMSTFMLAGIYTMMNLGVVVAVGLLSVLLDRIRAYKSQGLLYRVVLLGTLMLLVRRLPIPAGSPQFFGLVHYWLSYVLATLGTFVILRRVKQRGMILTTGILLVWMMLYQFFALIPQTGLR